jgi:hypothetical protein
MKILNLREFKKLPAGTLFMKYEPCVFYDLCVKGGTLDHDWFYESLDCVDSTDYGNMAEILFKAFEQGTSFKLDLDCTMRDGLFEDDQLFAVYEKSDVETLIDKLNRCKGAAYS